MDYSLDIPVVMEITGQDSSGNCAITMTGLPEQRFRDAMQAAGEDDAMIDEYLSEIDYDGAVSGKSASCSIPPGSVYAFASNGEGAETCSGPLLEGMMSIAR
jgi:hypothetical protein